MPSLWKQVLIRKYNFCSCHFKCLFVECWFASSYDRRDRELTESFITYCIKCFDFKRRCARSIQHFFWVSTRFWVPACQTLLLIMVRGDRQKHKKSCIYLASLFQHCKAHRNISWVIDCKFGITVAIHSGSFKVEQGVAANNFLMAEHDNSSAIDLPDRWRVSKAVKQRVSRLKWLK